MKPKFKKPLHLLIDGPDKVGKTTVVNLLSRKLDLPIIKMPNMAEYIEKKQTEEFSRLFNETVVQFAEYNFIMDRGFTTSLVYSKVFEREIDLSYIDSIWSKLDPVIFIIVPQDDDSLVKIARQPGVFGKDEIQEVEDKKDLILNGYRKFIYEHPGVNQIYVTGSTPHEICNEILETITTLLEAALPDLSGTTTTLNTKS